MEQEKPEATNQTERRQARFGYLSILCFSGGLVLILVCLGASAISSQTITYRAAMIMVRLAELAWFVGLVSGAVGLLVRSERLWWWYSVIGFLLNLLVIGLFFGPVKSQRRR